MGGKAPQVVGQHSARQATIARVEVFPVRLPLIKSFTFASGSAGQAGEGAPHVFVKVTASNGEVGWGEGRPVPQWSYETLETVATSLERYLVPAVMGLPVWDRWGLHRRMQATIGRGPSTGQPIAKAALDLAVHDLCGRLAELPLRCLLGGDVARRELALSYTVTQHEPDAAAAEVAEARAAGFGHFNFKAALHAERPEADAALGKAIRAAAGGEAFVWADANQGYALHQARRAARALAEAGVNVLEQPCAADQPHLLRQLRAASPIALAVDEASVGPADFFRYAAEGLVDYLVVKATRSGGLWPSQQQIAVAEAAGLPLLVSGLTDGLLTKLAACQLAAAHGCAGPAALNGSQFVDELALFPEKARVEVGGTVYLPDVPGIGTHPDERALRELAVRL